MYWKVHQLDKCLRKETPCRKLLSKYHPQTKKSQTNRGNVLCVNVETRSLSLTWSQLERWIRRPFSRCVLLSGVKTAYRLYPYVRTSQYSPWRTDAVTSIVASLTLTLLRTLSRTHSRAELTADCRWLFSNTTLAPKRPMLAYAYLFNCQYIFALVPYFTLIVVSNNYQLL